MAKNKNLNLEGKEFSKLIVLEQETEKTDKRGRTYWSCKCTCGKITSARIDNLKSGRTKSCGSPGCRPYTKI